MRFFTALRFVQNDKRGKVEKTLHLRRHQALLQLRDMPGDVDVLWAGLHAVEDRMAAPDAVL